MLLSKNHEKNNFMASPESCPQKIHPVELRDFTGAWRVFEVSFYSPDCQVACRSTTIAISMRTDDKPVFFVDSR
jgi:hypothetical protein